MKKLLTYVFAIIAFVACSESDVDNVSKISLSDTSIRFEGIGGSHMITFSATTDWNIEIDESAQSWCSLDQSSGSAGNRIIFVTVSPNLELDQKEREASLIITTDYTTEQVKIVQEYDHQLVLDAERKVLISFYETFKTGSFNHHKNEEILKNWGSNEPVSKWTGVYTNDHGRVTEIILQNYGDDLKLLIPSEISTLAALEVIRLNDNDIVGSIPAEIGGLSNLRELWLQGNDLTGTLSESLRSLAKLKDLRLYDNRLFGLIPESFYDWDFWQSWWGYSIWQNNFQIENQNLSGPKSVVKCFNGNTIDLSKEYAKNKYTILFQWNEDYQTEMVLPQLRKIYNSHSYNDVRIIGWTTSKSATKNGAISKAESLGMEWDNFYYDKSENYFGTPDGYPANEGTYITVVDSTGKIVFSDLFDSDVYLYDGHFIRLMDNDFKKIDSKKYESTDFSKDGEVKQLQKATKGNGIDIVLMGDAYSDRMISLYDRTMKTAMEKFFDVEPYKSFRDYFNVYSVTAISKNEVYTSKSSTAFSCYFGALTHVGGKDSKVFSYGRKAISEDRMDEALFVVVMNDNSHCSGTCYLFSSSGGDWGNGTAVAYFTLGWYDEFFERVLHHEAGGHGFAKLADEYDNKSGEIPENEIKSRQSKEKYGWWRNVDFTSDPNKVKWSHFLKDSRYKYDGLGVFEGAFTYAKGAYRPTENSIMNENTGGFNAPSREAIYYRIHKLAYGDDWEYDYEEFVRYDAKNRKKEESRGVPYRLDNSENFQPTHPPVVINKSWRDAE